MHKNIEYKSDERLNSQAVGAPVSANTHAIATAGEVFPDGSMIELIAGGPDGPVKLMLWDGVKETIGSRAEHYGQLYVPAPVSASVLRELNLPRRCHPHGTTRDLLAEICKLLANFVALDEKSASLVGRIVLCSALVDAVSVAPALVIVGPDIARRKRLMELLHCLCRHSVSLTGVTPAGFYSMTSSAQFTFLISQTTVSDKLQKVLEDSSNRDRKIPHRGHLLDLFGIQVIHSDSVLIGDFWLRRSIQISMIPTGQELPAFGSDQQLRITDEFQAKLLSFRRANLDAARGLHFDASRFSFELQNLACSMAAATPDDSELQAELLDLLREEDVENRSARWTDLRVITAEAVLVAYSESPGGFVYVSKLAEFAEGILKGRGEDTSIELGTFGKLLKDLGFVTEPRDAKGKKLRLTEAVQSRAQQLVRDFGGPEFVDDGQPFGNQRRKEA